MSMLDKNKIFFGLIHYILSEQKNVNWILKTSLIDFTGISSILEEKPYKKESLLDDVVDYVNSVKPYHVQFSHYFEHYETASELVSIPKNDKLETTINYRFDAIQTTPDIVKIVENIYEEQPETLVDGIYYEEPSDTYYTIKNGKITTDFDRDAFVNSHMANRLFYMGIHNLDELKKELNANFKGLEIDGHTFNIGDFGYELYDYSTNEYDSPTIVYDYCIVDPTESFDWFNKSKSFTTNNYTKVFHQSGNHRFNLPNIDTSGKSIKVFKQYQNEEPIEIDEYELKLNQQYGNYIDIYKGLIKNEKIIICLFETNNTNTPLEEITLSYAYIIVGHPFVESSSDVLKRQFVYLNNGELYLDTPASGLDTNKMVVQKQAINGSKSHFTKYQFSNSQIVLNSNDVNADEHIILTSFDYKYLYDKIYMWEDAYGRSNNIINLDGNEFLRARYESDRPREMVASSPLSSCMIYDYKNDNKFDIYYNDYKNDFMVGNYDSSQQIKITNITYSDEQQSLIKEITLENTKMLDNAPGKILINSEIIEYNHIDRDTNTISKLKRGIDGSTLYINTMSSNGDIQTHQVGEYILPFSDQFWYTKDKNYKYITHIINHSNQLTYDCPSGITDNSFVTVQLLTKISLLEDVNEKSTTIDINSYNIVPYNIQQQLESEVSATQYNAPDGEYFMLKINDETIPFKTIYKDALEENVYHIKNFILPEKYKNYGDKIIYSKEDSYIHSCLPTTFTDYEVSVVSYDDGYTLIEKNDEMYIADDNGDILYRIAGNILYDFKDVDVGMISSNNIIYKNDGSIMAKIVDDRFYNVKPIIILNYGLEKGTALHIKTELTNPNE